MNNTVCTNHVTHKLTKEQHLEICKLYESGKLMRQIANDYKVTVNTIHYHLKKNNVQTRCASSYNRLPAESNEEIKDMYLNRGFSTDQIASIFKVSKMTVLRRLHCMGIPIIPRVSMVEYEKMVDLRNNGLSNAQIALRIGRNENTVYRHIGCQPAEITDASKKYAARLVSIRSMRRNAAKLAMKRKLEEEARIEAERRAAEEAAREAARIAEENRRICEENLREIFTTCSLPVSEEFHLDSAEQGYSMIEKLHEMTAAHAVA